MQHALFPGTHNAYKPWALRKPALAFYLAVVLVAEGFFIASLYHADPLHVLLATSTGTVVAWALGAVAVVVGVLLLVTSLHHVHVQPQDVLFPGVVIFGAAVLLCAFNTLYGVSGSVLSAAVVQSQVLTLTNAERTQHNLGALNENALLDQAAARKAADMAAKGYFAHVSPDGTVPWKWIVESGYTYRYAGENLAVRFNESADVVNAWVASPSHYANIIKSQYTDIGVGTAEGLYDGQPAIYVVQYFGSQMQPSAPI